METAKNSESESTGDASPASNGGVSKPQKTVLPALKKTGSSSLDEVVEGIETEQVLRLREWYAKAKQRHEEYRRVDGMKTSNEKASRMYYALHTLLYTSICSTKTENLEKYVRNKAPTFAKSVFDIVEWEPALKSAKETRVQESKEIVSLKIELNVQRNEVGRSLSRASNVLHSFGQEMTTLKSTVQTEISQLQQILVLSQKQIVQVITQFTAKQDEMLNKLRLNAMSHHHDMRNEKQQREELGQQCEQLTKERDDLQERWKLMTVESEMATKRIAELMQQVEELGRQKEAFQLEIETLTATNLVLGQKMVSAHPPRLNSYLLTPKP